MAKLNQIIAIEKQVKKDAEDAITQAYKLADRKEAFDGHVRTYTPNGDPNDPTVEQLPTEERRVQAHVDDVLKSWADASIPLFDITATKVYANTAARADVVVDGTIILPQVPVEYLLFLEKRLDLTLQMLSKLPTLSPDFAWTLDPNSGDYVTPAVEQNRTKKVYRNHEKAPATDKHPAQVEVYTEETPIGRYSTVRHSGAITAVEVHDLHSRVTKLSSAVKQAREEANSINATDQFVGKTVHDYLFA